jgi:hypothetical protein
MEEYLYISQAKLESYYPQTSGKFSRLKKLGASLGLYGIKLSAEVDMGVDKSVIKQVREVETYLIKNQKVHGMDTPSDWVSGEGDAQSISFQEFPDLMFLIIDQPHHFFALAGGAYHQIGFTRPSKVSCRYSWEPDLLRILSSMASYTPHHLDTSLSFRSDLSRSGITFDTHPWTHVLEGLSNRKARKQVLQVPIRFLAEVIHTDRPEGKRRYTVATPLFISRRAKTKKD